MSPSNYLFEDLHNQLKNKQVVAVIGAGIALAATEQQRVASWVGLLEHGIGRCEAVVRHLPPGWANRVREEIRSGDLDDLLSAAEKIASKLGAPKGGEYRRWLRETVGSLIVKDDTVIKAIVGLGVPIATTNYDGLIEEVTGLPAFTWLDHAEVERLLRGDERGVLHLHGYWRRPESVILDIRSYERALHDDHFQTTLKALRTMQTFLFIGYGRGLEDPEFGALLRWSRAIFAESEYRHFRLALNSEVDLLQKEHDAAERIFVIGYGTRYADLTPFLRRLTPALHITEAPKPPNNLPYEISTFIGRTSELAEVERLLATPAIRLVTLTGVGGVGKTRLALKVATRILERFPQGIWYLQLAALSSPELLVQEVASALGVREAPVRRPLLEIVIEHIRAKRMLILLDTCDNLVAECAQLADTLLRSCPNLKILATSREALGVEGEIRWQVPPLVIPNGRWRVEDVKQCDSVQLFTYRAAEVKTDFQLTDSNARVIGRICQQLDGIPLAIELAAGRIKDLGTLEQIETRLNDRFAMLVKKSPAGPPRQRTMYATITWSYELLSEAERSLFNHLSVFAGGWILEMAEAICLNPEVEQETVMNLLAALVDKSLVVSEEIEGQARYRLLDSIKEYARERLTERDELKATQAKHTDYFVALTRTVEPDLWGSKQMIWVTRLVTEHENLRAALRWSLDNAPESALELVGNVWRFWQLRSYLTEGFQWTEAALARVPEQTTRRAKALLGAAYLARDLWDMEKAWNLSNESVKIFQQFGDDRGWAMAISNLAILARSRGDYLMAQELFKQSLQQAIKAEDKRAVGSRLANLGVTAVYAGHLKEAETYFSQSLPILREWGEKHIIILTLRFLGLLHESRGEYGRAKELYLESRKIAESIGDKVGIGASLCHLGGLAQVEGDYPKAQKLLRESLSILRDTGDRLEEAWALAGLAGLKYTQGRYEMAETLFRRSLHLFREIDSKRGMSRCLCFLGMLRVKKGDHLEGLCLIAAATASHPLSSMFMSKHDHDDYEATLETVRRILIPEVYSAIWREGHALDLNQTINQVLAE